MPVPSRETCIVKLHLILQIWDCNLGQLSGDQENALELEDVGSGMLYTVKSYRELLKRASKRDVEQSGVDCLIALKDVIPFSVRQLHGWIFLNLQHNLSPALYFHNSVKLR